MAKKRRNDDVTWLRDFLLGWRRRSALILDHAGAPCGLIRWRCRPMRGWGTVLRDLVDALERGENIYDQRGEEG